MRQEWKVWGALLVLVLAGSALGVATGTAATIHVPGDYGTIQAGIDAAVDGDEVVVAPGTYTGFGNRDLTLRGKRIVVRSSGGAEVTTIDCQGTAESHRRGFNFDDTSEPLGAAVEGFTIVNGFATIGGAMLLSRTAVAIRDCVMRDCHSPSGGGGAAVFASNAPYARIEQCVMEHCSQGSVQSAVHIQDGVSLVDCQIMENDGIGVSASSAFRIERCVVSGNTSIGVQVFNVYDEDIIVVFKDCVVTGNGGRGVEVWFSPELVIDGCTLVGNGAGLRISSESHGIHVQQTVINGNCPYDIVTSSTVTLSCTALDPDDTLTYGSATITYLDPPVATDPMFCDPVSCGLRPTADGDYHLMSGSPCLAENSPCGEQIGALGEGCEDVTSAPDVVGGLRDTGGFHVRVPGVQSGDKLAFQVAYAADGLLSAELLDATGRKLAASTFPQLGDRTPGAPQDLIWSVQAPAGTGVYFLRLIDSSGAQATAKFVWLDR